MNLQDIMVFGRGINPFGTCTGAAFPKKYLRWGHQ